MYTPQRKYLVISSVSDDSLHRYWLKGGRREFDLMLVYYGAVENKFKQDADYYLQKNGLFKLESVAAAVNFFRSAVEKYDAICLPDSDIIADVKTFNRMFRVFHDYSLDLAQPSLRGGFCNHYITLQREEHILRYVNFIEMMCPIFTRKALFEILPILVLNRSGYGIDYLWSKILADRKIAIIDAVGIYHKVRSRRVFSVDTSSNAYYNMLEARGILPEEEYRLIQKTYGLKVSNNKELGRIRRPLISRIVLFPYIKLMQSDEVRAHGIMRGLMRVLRKKIEKSKILIFGGGK